MIVLENGEKENLVVKFSNCDSKNLNICILNSCSVKSISDIYKKLNIIMSDNEYLEFVSFGYSRTLKGMAKEWQAHNLLYDLHILRSRTKDVDLENKQSWLMKIGYSILSFIYRIFHREKRGKIK